MDFLNLLERLPQTVRVTFDSFPDRFHKAEFVADEALKQFLRIGVRIDQELDINAPSGERAVRRLAMEIAEGEEKIEIALTPETTRGLIIILQRIYQNLLPGSAA